VKYRCIAAPLIVRIVCFPYNPVPGLVLTGNTGLDERALTRARRKD